MAERASRRRRVLVSVVLAAALVGPPPTAQVAEAAIGPSFVTRSGSQLMLDGHEYRFSGANIYSANSDGWCGPEYTDAELEEAFEEIGQGGPAVVRSWFFQPLAARKDAGVTHMWTGTRDWTRFDRMLALANQHDIRVIATLTDNWGECGGAGGTKPGSWYAGGYNDPLPALQDNYDHVVSYRDWVQEVVNRYHDDPTVLMWQLVNEAEVDLDAPPGCQGGDENGLALQAFAQDVSDLIRSLDPNHLISLGTIGGGQCGTESYLYEWIHDLPNIDVCEVHDYDQLADMPGDVFNGMMVRIEQCRDLNKPLFVGEVGLIPTTVGSTFEDRAAKLRSKILRQSAEGVVGFLSWAYMRTGSTIDNFDIGPGDPIMEVIAEAPAFIVNTTDDLDDTICTWDHCSLREAINDANLNPGVDTIGFAIAPFSGPAPVIQPTSELPDFIAPAVVDGTSQPFHGRVQLDGGLAGAANGLVIRGDSRVQGMSITGFATFARAGILATGSGNEIIDNVIGLDAAQSGPVPNWLGIHLLGPQNRVGAPGHGNVLAGNQDHGIKVGMAEAPSIDTHGNVIQGNVIGYNPGPNWDQVLSAPNLFAGIELNTTTGTLVGGSGLGEGNTISGNEVGIVASSPANVIQGNRLGTDVTGTVAVPNLAGITVSFGPDNLIGGGGPGEGNLISGNTLYGIQVDGTGPQNTRILGNLIGTDVTGVTALPNEQAGVYLTGNGVYVGSTGPGEGNVISGNTFAGIWIYNASQDVISSNQIGVAADGTTPLPNAIGVFIQTPTSHIDIGGGDPVQDNTIAHNSGAGIAIQGGENIAILRNRIHDNGGLGIDLGNDGPTANDPDDADGDANHFQNFPVLTAASTIGGTTTIKGTVDGEPGTPVIFMTFFENLTCDPSGFGEGETPIGMRSVAADANGDVSFSFNADVAVPLGHFVSVTATKNSFAGSETSEFSACFEVTDTPLDDTTSETAAAGQPITTDPEGDGATPGDPLETSVTPSVGGTVTIDETFTGTPPPAGYSLAGYDVAITAPPGQINSPIRIAVRLDASAIPAGFDASTLQLLRNGVPVLDCSPNEGAATPNPCLSERTTLPDGDVELVALTSQASLWQLATVTPYTVGGFYQPVDNLPLLNVLKAGQSVPVKFSLGGNRGLGVLATGSPTSVGFACGSAPVDTIEQTVSGNASGLSYDAPTGQYTLVWKTQKAWSGTCRHLTVRFDDGSILKADFKFTK